MDLEVGGLKPPKHKWVSLCHCWSNKLSRLCGCAFPIWSSPSPWASHLIQKCWLPRRCTVQVPSASSLLLYDESYSEWSLCSAVVHNSCKKSLISAVSTSKGCNQAYISGRMCSEKSFCFSFTQLEIQTIFDQFRGKAPKPAFRFASLIEAFCFPCISRSSQGWRLCTFDIIILFIFVRADL